MQSETIKYMYCVVCKNGTMSFEEKELILDLPLDETINNRFPSDDPVSNIYNLEVFKKGTLEECNEYLTNIDIRIRDKFRVEFLDEDSMKLV